MTVAASSTGIRSAGPSCACPQATSLSTMSSPVVGHGLHTSDSLR